MLQNFCRKVSKPEEKNRAKNRGEEEKFSVLRLYFFSQLFLFFFFLFLHLLQQLLHLHTKQREPFINMFLEGYVDTQHTHTFSPTTNQGLTKHKHSKK